MARILAWALPFLVVFVAGTGVAEAFIYWANYSTGTVGRAKLDGTGVNQVFITGLSHPSDVAVDADYIYWTDDAGIGRANLDGSGVNKTFIMAPASCGIAVNRGHIYWSNAFPGTTIGRANLDGSGVNPSFITGAADPCGVAVDSAHIYWSNSGIGQTTVGRANLDGSGVNHSFISGANRPYDVVADATHIYWANRGASPRTVGRANLNGANVNQAFITSTYDAWGLAVNSANIFWGNNGVGRATLAGTGVNQLYIATHTSVGGIAVDAVETIQPVTTITAGPPATTSDSSATFTFASSRPGSTFECQLDASNFTPCASPAAYGGLSDGQHTFAVRATDAFGNTETTPATTRWTVDATPPVVAISSPINGSVYDRGRALTAAYTCSDAGTGLRSCAGDVVNGAKIDTTKLGRHTFAVVAIDNVGNRRTATVAYSVVAEPRITSDVVNEWLFFRRYTVVSKLLVSKVPAGATVKVRCSGRGCRFKSKSLTFRKATRTVNLKRFFNFTRKRNLVSRRGSRGHRRDLGRRTTRRLKVVSRLAVGTRVEIRITAPGTIGKYVRYTMRARAIPSTRKACLAPGTNARVAC